MNNSIITRIRNTRDADISTAQKNIHNHYIIAQHQKQYTNDGRSVSDKIQISRAFSFDQSRGSLQDVLPTPI